jgi:hypothetical protein
MSLSDVASGLSARMAGAVFAAAVAVGALIGFSEGGEAASRQRVKAASKPVAARLEPIPEGPLTVVVSIRDQRLSVYSGTEQIARAPISSGARGHETPTGIFSVIQKERMHYSNLYNNAPMPFMQRLTWSGIALHAGYLPGYPASHGCVRMPHDFARRLFTLTRMGARVIVTHADTAPVALVHQRLALLAGTPHGVAVAGDEPRTVQPGLPSPPMHLGAAVDPVGGGASGEPTVVAPHVPSRSLLRQAEQAVAERVLALEAARAVRSATASRLDDTLQLLREAREANQTGRAEVSRSRHRAKSLDSELQALLARLRSQHPGATGEEFAAAERADPEAQAITDRLETARVEADDKEETLREIGEEAAALERARAEASVANENAVFRLKIAEDRLREARRELNKRQQPVSLFVSRKNGRLYVRQGFEPLLETQVSIDDPSLPIGTHVFSAIGTEPGGQIRWTAVSVPVAAATDPRSSSNAKRRLGSIQRERIVEAAPPPVHGLTASAALDRLRVPEDVVAQLSALIKPGASLIISDQPLSQETGKATDLIVLTR